MAAYSLVLDFDGIQQGVRNGAPRQFAWLGAFGIMVTVVWLYVEILRILAIAARLELAQRFTKGSSERAAPSSFGFAKTVSGPPSSLS